MQSRASILVVDDDREIRTLVAELLEANGFDARAVADGNGMWDALTTAPPDLIILDLNLPGDDGLSLCRKLRDGSNVPVIMLTARGSAIDRVLGLELGADDYLPKPFEPRELLARIRGVLRRMQAPAPAAASAIRFGTWTLDLQARHLVNAQDVVVAISGAEYRLLKAFLGHPNQVLSREQLLDLTKGRELDSFDRSIDLQVSRLRQRLGDDARAQELIRTVRKGTSSRRRCGPSDEPAALDHGPRISPTACRDLGHVLHRGFHHRAFCLHGSSHVSPSSRFASWRAPRAILAARSNGTP